MKEQVEVIEQTEEQDLADARSIRAKMKRLMENEDFRFLCANMQAKLDATVLSVFISPQGVDTELVNLYTRGKVAGFNEAMNYAQLLLNGAEGTIDMHAPREKAEEEKEEEEVNG